MHPDLIHLNRLRLERDLTYGRLAGLIGLKRQTLFRLLSTDSAPHDRTLYKIRQFLAGTKKAQGLR
jgi:transcriptional regulator with XRE-family HTH domain